MFLVRKTLKIYNLLLHILYFSDLIEGGKKMMNYYSLNYAERIMYYVYLWRGKMNNNYKKGEFALFFARNLLQQ
jgi:hypothetical protein